MKLILKRKFIFIVFFLFIKLSFYAQEREILIDSTLSQMSRTNILGLTQNVDISVSNTSLQSFFSALSRTHNINLVVDPKIKDIVSLSFKGETVKNVILFLCKQYDLDISSTGNILYISKVEQTPIEQKAKELTINYDRNKDLLSFDLSKDTLSRVTKKIAQLSNKNISIQQGLDNLQVNGYIQNVKFDNAIERLAFSNDLEAIKDTNGIFTLRRSTKPLESKSSTGDNQSNKNKAISKTSIKTTSDGLISFDLKDGSIKDLIIDVSDKLGVSYLFNSLPEGNITAKLENVNYDQFLTNVLNGTKFTFSKDDNLYTIGERLKEGLRDVYVYQLNYRSIDKIVSLIPKDLSEGVVITPFIEQNSLVLSGAQPNLNNVKNFLTEIDKPVPVVLIELLIIDVKRTHNVQTGISAGLGKGDTKSSGSLFPGVDINLGSSTLNEILNIFGLKTLGAVVPEFYANLKLLEQNGYINIQSTPRLSTLNGHEATMNLGETSYYLEQQQNIIGTQSPQTVVTNTYKSVQADFSITITPVVSGDEQVTLDIDVNQSDFTGRISPNAPPGQTHRQFKSSIRIKNEEMIVLGGLETNERNETGEGLPVLSRVPGLKWLFAKKTKDREKSKLIVFIKPTIIY